MSVHVCVYVHVCVCMSVKEKKALTDDHLLVNI